MMRIAFKTYGCTLNQSDTEVMMGLLELAGHKIVEDAASADAIIFNTCTVKDSPEKSFYSSLKKAKKEGKIVLVAGCVSQADPDNQDLQGVSIIGVRHLENIAEVVEAASGGKVVRLIDFKKNNRLNLPKIRKNPVVEIIPISSGCLGDCTFCKTRFARGKLYSYPIESIEMQMKEAISDGVKEIWLTSQDAGAYGKDIGSDLTQLLSKLVLIPGDHKIRLGMINPSHAKHLVPGLVSFLNHPKAFKFIHLPIQSGSDNILSLMKRRYDLFEFTKLVFDIRSSVPGVTIATDIITGFPEETEDDHEKTLQLVEKIRFPVINMTKFYPMQGTRAAMMKLHPTKLVKKRMLELIALQKKLMTNEEWVGRTCEIILDEIGKNNTFVGRNEYYLPVVIKKEDYKLGDYVSVKIKKAFQHYLIGEPIHLIE